MGQRQYCEKCSAGKGPEFSRRTGNFINKKITRAKLYVNNRKGKSNIISCLMGCLFANKTGLGYVDWPACVNTPRNLTRNRTNFAPEHVRFLIFFPGIASLTLFDFAFVYFFHVRTILLANIWFLIDIVRYARSPGTLVDLIHEGLHKFLIYTKKNQK